MNELGITILSWLLGIVGTVLTTVLTTCLASWIKSKTNNEKLNYVIDEINQTVQTSIDYVNQTFVNQLKADGKFDAENQAEALEKAVNQVINNLSDKTTSILEKDNINIEDLIKSYIEAKIAQSKK